MECVLKMESLNDIKDRLSGKELADFHHALSWKENSKALFDTACEINSFKIAVKWCGVNGNVTRTAYVDHFNEFVELLWNNIDNIKKGSFELSDFKLSNGKKPISWASKMCHIINPKDYPIIYDEKVRKYYKLKDLKDFIKKMNEVKEYFKNETDNFFYEYDAAIWAIDN